jgi:hypothetical protein
MVDSTVPLSLIVTRKRTAAPKPPPSDPSNKLRSPDRDRGIPKVGLVRDTPLQGNPMRSESWRKQPGLEFTQTVPGEGDGELARPSSGIERLFNSTTGNPDIRSDVMKVLEANPAPAAVAPRAHDKQAHMFRLMKELQRRKDIQTRDVFSPVPPKSVARVQPPQFREGGGHPALIVNPTRSPGEQVFAKKNLVLVLRPEARQISQEQLVAEVKGIYAGLVMVEAKCMGVDDRQARDVQEAEPSKQPKLNNEQWQALVAIHRMLLYEHHDFFLAFQHPSADPSLPRLALKYAMLARMWRHWIHSFLELLRHQLIDSLERMLAIPYLAYCTTLLLYKTVRTFENTLTGCLEDLVEYCMAIGDDGLRDREIWTGVVRPWYIKAAGKDPTVGRLYHHPAILAQPNVQQQLYCYTRSLSCVQHFLSDRESTLTPFDPILCRTELAYYCSLPVDTEFTKGLQDLENDSPEIHELQLQQWYLENRSKSDTAGVPEEHLSTASKKANDLLKLIPVVASTAQYQTAPAIRNLPNRSIRRQPYPHLVRPILSAPPTLPVGRVCRRKLHLPGSLNGIIVDAIPDTGSSRNVISGNFARANGLPIYRTPARCARVFQFANRNLKRSAGRCILDWKFADEPYNTYSAWFEVLEGLPHDVVIGNPLLVNSAGSPRKRLIASLNRKQVYMLPDTGSERNIISESYARERGFQIRDELQNRVWLVFADGSIQETIGQVEAYLGLDDNPFRDFPITFDVLTDCAHDVIIGEGILYEKEVFLQYVDRLQDIWLECDYDEFSLVGLAIFEGCFSSKHRTVHEGACNVLGVGRTENMDSTILFL